MRIQVYYRDFSTLDRLNLRFNLVGADQLPDGRLVAYIDGDDSTRQEIEQFINRLNKYGTQEL